MMSQPDVDQLIRQTRRYEFSDGLRDLQLAVLLGLGGTATWLALQPFWFAFIGTAARAFGRWAAWIGMLPLALVVLAVWGMVPLMNTLRDRWLWRESGRVKPSSWAVPRRVSVLSAVILVGAIGIGVVLRLGGWGDDAFVLRMLWSATGWSFGYTLMGVGRHIDLPRYVWLGAVGGTLSTGLLFLPLNFSQASLVFGLTWSLLLMTSGILTLRSVARSLKKD